MRTNSGINIYFSRLAIPREILSDIAVAGSIIRSLVSIRIICQIPAHTAGSSEGTWQFQSADRSSNLPWESVNDAESLHLVPVSDGPCCLGSLLGKFILVRRCYPRRISSSINMQQLWAEDVEKVFPVEL